MFMSPASMLQIGNSIWGGSIGASAAGKASSEQQNMLQQALGTLQSYYNTTANNINPWIKDGQSALGAEEKMLGLTGSTGDYSQFTSSPGYQFQMNQGTNAVNSQISAGKTSAGGNALKALQSYGQGVANQGYGTYMNQLSGLSNTGLGAATSLGQIGANSANSQANVLGQIGNAQAAGTIGQANAWTGALSNINQIAQNQDFMSEWVENFGNSFSSMGSGMMGGMMGG